MRVVFMGTPEFAVPSLERLAENHELVAVYTRPDKARGRGRTPIPTPVKHAAISMGIEVRDPKTLTDPVEIDVLRSYRPDVICVAAYGLILPSAVLELPAHGCMNVHASLLPRHRGAAPIHRAILDGDSVTGVSIMLMDEGLDTGPYAVTKKTQVGDKDVAALETELARLGAEALLETLELVGADAVEWVEQDESAATYANKMTSADVSLSPELSTETAMRRVRASTRSARAKVRVADCVLDVTRLRKAPDRYLASGRVQNEKSGLYLGFHDAVALAEEVRPEGRSCMEGCSWARGARLSSDATWSSV